MDAEIESSIISEKNLDHLLEINGNVTDAKVYMYKCLDKEKESYKNGSHMITVFFTSCADIKDILAITHSPIDMTTTTTMQTTTIKVVKVNSKVKSFVDSLTDLFINKFYDDPTHLHDAINRENVKKLVVEYLISMSREEKTIDESFLDKESELQDKVLLQTKAGATTNKLQQMGSNFLSDDRETSRLKQTSNSTNLEQNAFKKLVKTETNFNTLISSENILTVELGIGYNLQHKLKGQKLFYRLTCSVIFLNFNINNSYNKSCLLLFVIY